MYREAGAPGEQPSGRGGTNLCMWVKEKKRVAAKGIPSAM